jgi:hypothetical protein
MTARSTFEATNATSATPTSAAATRVASNVANANVAQEIIAAVAHNAGTSLAHGVSIANDVTIRAANAAYIAAKQKATMIEEVTIQNAKDVLRSTGDTAPC